MSEHEMVEVTADRFFEVVGPMDVHPNSLDFHTIWETPQREVVGRSLPGWKQPGEPKVYFLTSSRA